MAPSRKNPPLTGLDQLRGVQRKMAQGIMQPLTPGWRSQLVTSDGASKKEFAATFIKPNSRLSSFERLEIYNKQYWFRLIDSFADDYPGLRTALGQRKFNKLMDAYLQKHPSTSFTLRNLGQHLVNFIEATPELVLPHQQMALQLARFEWAQIEAFDNAALPPVAIDDLLGQDPATIRLSLQPYITLLELNYELDDFVIAVKRGNSNTTEAATTARALSRARSIRRPRKKNLLIAVHRFDNSIYYKRLDPPAFAILLNLRGGATLAEALAKAIHPELRPPRIGWPAQIKAWFEGFTRLGWFCGRVDA